MDERRAQRLATMTTERAELLRSLEDLAREHDSGDLGDGDYERLRRAYVARTSALVVEMERLADAPAGGRVARTRAPRLRRALGRRSVRRTLMALFACWLAAAATLAALHFSGARLPGQSATGSISVSEALAVRQELAQAAQLSAMGRFAPADELYARVLATVPDQREALTFQGWLVRLTGIEAHRADVVARGDAELARAVEVAPGYPDARALDAIALADDRDELTRALAELRALVADHPPASLLRALRPQLAAIYARAKVALPGVIRRA